MEGSPAGPFRIARSGEQLRNARWRPWRTYTEREIPAALSRGRALRIETVINDAGDLGCRRRLEHLEELQAKARDVNDRLLHHERVGVVVWNTR